MLSYGSRALTSAHCKLPDRPPPVVRCVRTRDSRGRAGRGEIFVTPLKTAAFLKIRIPLSSYPALRARAEAAVTPAKLWPWEPSAQRLKRPSEPYRVIGGSAKLR